MNIELIGRKIFGIGMVYLSILSIISNDFIIGRPPPINTFPVLAYGLSITILVASILIIFNQRNGGIASLLIALLILVFSFLVRFVPFVLNAPTFESAFWALNGYKTLALIGGGLIISASFIEENKDQSLTFLQKKQTAKYFRMIGSITLALFLVISGFAHFKYADFVRDFIPPYIPFRTFWTYFCGLCLIAGGIGILVPPTRRLAAFLSGIMILGWFILLHIPRIISNINDASDRMGLGESFTFVGICFVLASLLRSK
jgi:uncharacterized membrane protein YphA (DoxX/SURF4 family)